MCNKGVRVEFKENKNGVLVPKDDEFTEDCVAMMEGADEAFAARQFLKCTQHVCDYLEKRIDVGRRPDLDKDLDEAAWKLLLNIGQMLDINQGVQATTIIDNGTPRLVRLAPDEEFFKSVH